jgi:cell wall-associated NlpC family hydrolase
MSSHFDVKSDSRLNISSNVERSKNIGRVIRPVINLYKSAEVKSGTISQALYGETLFLFDSDNHKVGWQLVQRQFDGYVGYVQSADFEVVDEVIAPTHQVAIARTFLYHKVDLKTPDPIPLSLGTKLFIEKWQEVRGTQYGILSGGGAVIATHIASFEESPKDYVEVAEGLIDTPYLWGGNSAFGIDCSGLVQLAKQVCGECVLRDSDMQEATCGAVVDAHFSYENLQRGDLIFWKGHVGIMQSHNMLLHANGHTMSVAIEPIKDAVERIKYLYDEPTSIRHF